MKTLHWTLRDLELLPDDGNRNVKEHWVVNWRERTLEVYRREDA